MSRPPAFRPGAPGFTLIEMIVVVFLLALAMLGILSVFDASARINKSEQDIADAQGAVRYGIYSMTRSIRMAGAGGLYVTQAVLNHRDPQLPGITVVNAITDSYDNVGDGTTVTSSDQRGQIPVRPNTDMIEVRGVINSPLIGFDLQTGCEPCDTQGCSPCIGQTPVDVLKTTGNRHVNDDPKRPQFSQIDAYTANADDSAMLVIVAFNDDIHAGCTINLGPQAYPLFPQTPYNVGVINGQTNLAGSLTFGPVDFTDSVAQQFNPETPEENAAPPQAMKNIRHVGILDDLIFFIDNTDPNHPALAQGTRRANAFDVVTLADDVEDMQIAYGVDKSPTLNNAIDATEWKPVVTADAPYNTVDFQSATPPGTPPVFTHPGDHCPRLHGVEISLVAKSHDPDPTYKSPNRLGLATMNSPAVSGVPLTAQYPSIADPYYRRRVQTLRINLRNYAYEGLKS